MSFRHTIKTSYKNCDTFPSVAGGKVAYLKQLKYEDFHRKRLIAHIRSQVFGTNEYSAFIPSKRTGRKILGSRLKGPILTSFYEDTNDRVLYSSTRNRKAQMQAITDYEQETLFTYRRRKNRFWSDKIAMQMGKLKLADKHNAGEFVPMYRYKSLRDMKQNMDSALEREKYHNEKYSKQETNDDNNNDGNDKDENN